MSKRTIEQVIAEVDITKSEDFAAGGKYAAYADAIEPSEVVKRDLVASFMSVGYLYAESYGYSYADAYELIKDSLVNRAIYLQYAQVYFFESGDYTVAGYEAAVSSASEADKDIAGLALLPRRRGDRQGGVRSEGLHQHDDRLARNVHHRL